MAAVTWALAWSCSLSLWSVAARSNDVDGMTADGSVDGASGGGGIVTGAFLAGAAADA
jgi:hypothetical protein